LTWKKNPNISAPFVLTGVILFALILPFFAVSYFIFGIGANNSNASVSPAYALIFIIILILFIVLLGLIVSFFQSGAVEMAREATANGKAEIGCMWGAGKRRYGDMFIANILVLLIWLGASVVAIMPFLIARGLPSIIGLISGLGIIFAFVVLLLVDMATSLVPYALIIDNLRPIEAVKASFGFFRLHKRDVLFISILIFIISIILSLIGGILNVLGSQVLIALWMPIRLLGEIIVWSLGVVWFTRPYMSRTGKLTIELENTL
jgi:hypothetical protein